LLEWLIHMTLINVISYLLVWGIIGAALFSLFVFSVFRTGIVYTARKEDGLLKERIPLTGYLISAGFWFSLFSSWLQLIISG